MLTVKILKCQKDLKELHWINVEIGMYWGYTVQVSQTLGELFSQVPYSEGYDLTIGTSE